MGFAMLFGNKDKNNWMKFCKFLKSVHPIVSQSTKTIIMDQDKGSLASNREIVPEAGLFHCAFHRCQNIKKKFGGGEGNTPFTCLWMYNILVKCSSGIAIHFLCHKYEPQMKPEHLAYLNSLADNQQFLAAHCKKARDIQVDICMYGKVALSRVEPMNQANDDVRQRTVINILNAALVLIKKEGNCYLRGEGEVGRSDQSLPSFESSPLL